MKLALNSSTPAKKRRWFLFIVIATVVLILLTRKTSLSHGILNHPDEGFFYVSASSVVYEELQGLPVESELHEGRVPYQFVPLRDNYPQGAVVYQIPIQFLARAAELITGIAIRPALAGRLAGVFYFTLAAVLGLRLVYILSKKNLWAVAFFGTILAFSTFHIEQSRYGTGDPIALFVLALVLTLLERYRARGGRGFLWAAAFFAGTLGAIKVPLLAFLALPFAALLLARPQDGNLPGRSRRIMDIFLILAFAAGGLLLFTPSFFTDPSFFYRSIFVESGSYLSGTGVLIHEGSLAANALSWLLYTLLYAGFPLALPFTVYGVVRLSRPRAGEAQTDKLFALWLPLINLLICVAHLFSTLFIFRSFYVFLFVANIYTALGLTALMEKKWARVLITALLAFLVVKGSLLTWALGQPSTEERALGMITENENWGNRTITMEVSGEYSSLWRTIPPMVYTYPTEYLFTEDHRPILNGGEFAVSGAAARLEQFRPFGLGHGEQNRIITQNWQAFKEENEPFFIDTAYPGYIKPLFGSWLHGSTLGMFEFPEIYAYYKNEGAPVVDSERRALWDALCRIEDNDEYLAALLKMEEITLIAVSKGEPGETAEALSALPGVGELSPDGSLALLWSDGVLIEKFTGEGTLEADVTLPDDIPCHLTSGVIAGGVDQILIGDRNYALNDIVNRQSYGDGLCVAVFDEVYGRVMEWRVLSNEG